MSHRRHKRNMRKPERVQRALERETTLAELRALPAWPKLQLRTLEFRGHGHCAEAVRLRALLQEVKS